MAKDTCILIHKSVGFTVIASTSFFSECLFKDLWARSIGFCIVITVFLGYCIFIQITRSFTKVNVGVKSSGSANIYILNQSLGVHFLYKSAIFD